MNIKKLIVRVLIKYAVMCLTIFKRKIVNLIKLSGNQQEFL